MRYVYITYFYRAVVTLFYTLGKFKSLRIYSHIFYNAPNNNKFMSICVYISICIQISNSKIFFWIDRYLFDALTTIIAYFNVICTKYIIILYYTIINSNCNRFQRPFFMTSVIIEYILNDNHNTHN